MGRSLCRWIRKNRTWGPALASVSVSLSRAGLQGRGQAGVGLAKGRDLRVFGGSWLCPRGLADQEAAISSLILGILHLDSIWGEISKLGSTSRAL